MAHQEQFGGTVAAVALSGSHDFSKPRVERIAIVAGQGVVGDAHAGALVQHLSRVATDPMDANLRQVHLLHAELLDDLRRDGFDVQPGQMGENITTSGIALLDLPRGTLLQLGQDVVLEVTGLRNPCRQIEAFRPGLLHRVARRCADGSIERLAGIMSIVLAGGTVRPGDAISVILPAPPHLRLEPV